MRLCFSYKVTMDWLGCESRENEKSFYSSMVIRPVIISIVACTSFVEHAQGANGAGDCNDDQCGSKSRPNEAKDE